MIILSINIVRNQFFDEHFKNFDQRKTQCFK